MRSGCYGFNVILGGCGPRHYLACRAVRCLESQQVRRAAVNSPDLTSGFRELRLTDHRQSSGESGPRDYLACGAAGCLDIR